MLGFDSRAPAAVLVLVLAGCAGNGEGLDANGNPLGAGNEPPPPLTADFQSIQDNVFTPICARCHSGPGAPEGLQLDAAHSYALLVGVPSTEDPKVLRVQPGAPDQSYLVLKLQGSPGILGAQMPFGGPYLPQTTIDVIRQWISDGALQSATASARRAPQFSVTTLSPAEGAVATAPTRQIVVAFSHEVDAGLINYTTIRLERLSADGPQPASDALSLAIASGNPSTVLITPSRALGPGTYRLLLRGSGGAALADLDGHTLEHDYTFVFTVDEAR
jgi:Bacterial Ig-like domain